MPIVRSVIPALTLAAALASQCIPSIQPGNGLPETSGLVNATVAWDPDGAGPEPQALVVAGQFVSADNAATTQFALWKPSSVTWEALGAASHQVSACSVCMCGSTASWSWPAASSRAGDIASMNIAVWHGITWWALGSGLGVANLRNAAISRST